MALEDRDLKRAQVKAPAWLGRGGDRRTLSGQHGSGAAQYAPERDNVSANLSTAFDQDYYNAETARTDARRRAAAFQQVSKRDDVQPPKPAWWSNLAGLGTPMGLGGGSIIPNFNTQYNRPMNLAQQQGESIQNPNVAGMSEYGLPDQGTDTFMGGGGSVVRGPYGEGGGAVDLQFHPAFYNGGVNTFLGGGGLAVRGPDGGVAGGGGDGQGGFGSYYGGNWRRGGGFGGDEWRSGYDYPPSWLMNLYDWRYKG